MKKILTLILLVYSLFSGATNYYFRPDGATTNTGLSDAQAWNLAKFNSVFSTLAAGDSCLFKRGTVFTGTIQISRSGASGNHIIIGAYGANNLAKPVISGFQSVSGWINTNGNIWESAATSCKSTLNMVTVNGINTAMGRLPNSSAANGGYLTYESSTATTITDNQLSASPNWTGAEAVIRKNAWIINRCPISNHSATTLTYSDASGYTGLADWGYFIQNDIRTLDSQNEWFLDKATKKISVYSTVNPSTLIVKASIYDTLVYATSNRSYITFSNLVFEGGNLFGFYWNSGTDVKVLDCDFRFIGKDGIRNDNLSYNSIIRCTFTDINDNVVYGNSSSTNGYFAYSTVTRSGLIPGNSGAGDGHNFGVSMQADNCIAEYNKITNMGYIGMLMAGNNCIFRFNYVDSVCIMKDDGAGIYVSGALTTTMSNRIVRRNIVGHSFGNLNGKAAGTIAQANGIYVDGTGNNVLIDSNTVFNCTANGLYYGFYTHTLTTVGNLFINNLYQFAITENDNTDNNFVTNGNVFATTTNQELIRIVGTATGTPRPVSTIGTWSGNYYIKPFGNKQILSFINKTTATRVEYVGIVKEGFAQYDANMKFMPVTITPYVINSYITANQYTNGTFNANITGVRQFYYSGASVLSWDNTNQITAGTAKIALTTLGTQNNTVAFAVPVNTVEVGKKYLVKFDIKGGIANSAVDVHLRDHATPYPFLMSSYNFYQIGNTASTQQILLEPLITSNADVFIQVTDADLPVYLDNFEFREANITKADPDDYIRFEYNTTPSVKVVSLAGSYLSVNSTRYTGSIAIQPYSSALLFKDVNYVGSTGMGYNMNNNGKAITEKGKPVKY